MNDADFHAVVAMFDRDLSAHGVCDPIVIGLSFTDFDRARSLLRSAVEPTDEPTQFMVGRLVFVADNGSE